MNVAMAADMSFESGSSLTYEAGTRIVRTDMLTLTETYTVRAFAKIYFAQAR